MSFWENSKTLLPVYKNMAQQTLAETVNIMLTPQFYILKKVTLPVQYAFQAKKVAASMFDGLLEHPQNSDYLVYKENDDWVFIAYDLKEISHFLSTKGISADKVGKIFFAQQALSSFSTPVRLGSKDALVSMDGTVVLVPQSALEDNSKTVLMDEGFTPKNGISLHGAFNSFISQKQALGIAALFTLFALAFFAEGWRYSQSSQNTKAEITALLEEYPTLQSAYTRQSIAAKYRNIDKNERKKRDTVKTLAGMIFKGVKVDTFKMNEKGFAVRFKCTDAKVAKHLRELAKKEGFPSVKTLTGNIVSIEEKL